MDKGIDYFTNHKLYSKKSISYQLWMEIYESIKKGEHLSPDSRNDLKMKTQQITKLMYLKKLSFFTHGNTEIGLT